MIGSWICPVPYGWGEGFMRCSLDGVAAASIHPGFAVEAPVLDGFGNMGFFYCYGAFEIGDSAADLEDSIVGAGGEMKVLHGDGKGMIACRLDGADFSHEMTADLGVAVNVGPAHGFIPDALDLTGGDNTLSYLRGGFSFDGGIEKIGTRDGCYFYMEIDAIEQRTRDATEIFLNGAGRAYAFFLRIAMVAAWAGVHAGQ